MFNYPIRICWEVTYLCNYKCIHCYNQKFIGKNKDEFTIKEMEKFFDSIKGKVFEIVIGGGEPLAKKGIAQVVKKYNKFFNFYIASNGSLLSEGLLKKFSKNVVFQISIDGLEKTHNFIRNRQTAYQESLRAIRLLKSEGYKFAVGIMICKFNINEIRELVEILKNDGVDNFNFLTYIGDDSRLRLGKDDFLYLNDFFNKLGVKKTLRDPIFDCSTGECQAGITTINIRPDGTVTPCCYLPVVMGNIKKNTLEDIWLSNRFKDIRFRKEPKECLGCKIESMCRGGCLARKNDYTQKDNICFKKFIINEKNTYKLSQPR